jgi:hypothetical protein
MNEQLQVALAEILNTTIEATGKATDFLIAEIPEVLQQLLMWKMCESVVWFVCGLILIIGGLVLFFKSFPARAEAINSAKEDRKDGKEWTRYCGNKSRTSNAYDSVVATGGVESVSFLLGGAVAFFCGLHSVNILWLQIWIAPKVYLLEYAASLAK